MDQYEIFKSMIDEVLSLDDYIDNEEYISLYSLYQMVKERLAPLSQTIHNQDILKKIESNYSKRGIRNFFRKNNNNNNSIKLYYDIGRDKSTIMMNRNHEYRYLSRDIGGTHFYCNSYQTMIDPTIVEKCVLDFNEIFDTLEEYSSLFIVQGKDGDIEIKTIDNYSFSIDDIFYGRIHYNYGDVDYTLNIHGLTHEYMDRTWYGNRENLREYLQRNEINLLKKIPIKVESLNDVFLKIYEEKQKNKVYSK